MKNILRFLGIHKFTFTWFLDRVDVILNTLLEEALDSGVEAVKKNNDFYIQISFKNGYDFKMWDSNKYYSWLSSGWIGKNDKVLYSWNQGRPRRKTMLRLYDMLNNVKLEQLGNGK